MPTAIKVSRGALLGLIASLGIGWWLPIHTVDLQPVFTKKYEPADNRLGGIPPSSERGGR